MPIVQSRRRFLSGLAFTGAAGLGGLGVARPGSGTSLAAEPPPEITTIRFEIDPYICGAPQFIAGELLRAEGFADIRYVEMTELDTSKGGIPYMIANGDVDLAMDFGAVLINGIDAGHSLTVLTGIHAGCFELFANSGISGIKDLKDRTVGIRSQGLSKQLVSLMVSYVGLDPVKDIHWVADPSVAPMQRFIDGKIDAFLASAPQPQELRARKIGHVLVNSSVDHPWSNYFCCMLAGNKEFVRRYPVATKRALRAILKTADLCASDPKRAAQLMTDRGFDVPFDYLLQGLSEIRYDVWRDYDPEDTLRFYTLRMQEVGMIKSSPQKILAQGTDWHFLNELKRELKT